MFDIYTPEDFSLINNWAGIDKVKHQLKSDLYLNEEWALYNNNSWEGFNGSTEKGNIK